MLSESIHLLGHLEVEFSEISHSKGQGRKYFYLMKLNLVRKSTCPIKHHGWNSANPCIKLIDIKVNGLIHEIEKYGTISLNASLVNPNTRDSTYPLKIPGIESCELSNFNMSISSYTGLKSHKIDGYTQTLGH